MGLWINIGSLCWLVPIFVFTMFPGKTLTTPTTMDWVIMLFEGMTVLAAVYICGLGTEGLYFSKGEAKKRYADVNT